MNFAPVTSAGTVYGILLNAKDEWAAWAARMSEPPYKAPPTAPVLYVKTANTWSACGSAIDLPTSAQQVEIGASLAMVFGSAAQRVSTAQALSHVAGYLLVNDLSLPHASFYRPPVKFKNLDGFLGIGPRLATPADVGDPACVQLEVRVDGTLRQTVDCAQMLRPAAQLIADVSEFMTLRRGDVLLLGLGANRPLARAGQRIEISAPGIPALGTLTNTLVAEAMSDAGPPQGAKAPSGGQRSTRSGKRGGQIMKRARVVYDGAIHDATERNGQLLLGDGRLISPDAVVWLPPLDPVPWPRTILALGLNYADHAKELAFKAPEEPLVFIKGEGALIGHRAHSLRPRDATFMHYECELAVVIGRTAKKVKRDDAYDYIAGYTVANDYAIRDYLENWYRPNLRVKNRDTCTPLGPWLVDAADVPNPMNLALQTTVNGKLTQSGHTRDMIFDVPFLIEYFSSFMTLNPGDLILTGTPDGVVDCQPGDVIVTEIEGVGALENRIAAQSTEMGSEPDFVQRHPSPSKPLS